MECGNSTVCTVAVALAIAATVGGRLRGDTQSTPSSVGEAPKSKDTALAPSSHEPPLLEMSVEEYSEFTRQRKVYRERLMRYFCQLDRQHEQPAIQIQRARTREALTPLALKGDHLIRLTRVMEDCRGAWLWFPETTELDISRFEADTIPETTVAQIASLPHLKRLTLATSKSVDISEESLEILSKHGELEELDFGRCRITPKEFSQLARLKTLSRVTVCGRVTPRCFVTLAKLPRFERFILVGGSRIDSASFGDPIDEETRRAIVSLNGRLQCVSAIEETLPQMHGTLLRALGAVESLEVLDLGGVLVREVTLQDIEALQHLSNLRHFVLAAQYAPSVTPEERKRADEVVRQIKRRVGERQRIEKQTMLREAGVLPGNSSP